jgi:hypothetical protein
MKTVLFISSQFRIFYWIKIWFFVAEDGVVTLIDNLPQYTSQ